MKNTRGFLAVAAWLSIATLTTTTLSSCTWMRNHHLWPKKKTTASNLYNTPPAYNAEGGNGAGVDIGEIAGRPPAVREGAENQVPELRTVYFDYDSSDLNAEARSALDSAAAYLQSNASINVQVQGHCDERGTREYNYALGQRRSDTVREYLVQKGISGSRLNSVSYGEDRPVAPGHDESAWAQNRRVQFMGY